MQFHAERRSLERARDDDGRSLTVATRKVDEMDEMVARLKAEVGVLRRQRATLEVELGGAVHESETRKQLGLLDTAISSGVDASAAAARYGKLASAPATVAMPAPAFTSNAHRWDERGAVVSASVSPPERPDPSADLQFNALSEQPFSAKASTAPLPSGERQPLSLRQFTTRAAPSAALNTQEQHRADWSKPAEKSRTTLADHYEPASADSVSAAGSTGSTSAYPGAADAGQATPGDPATVTCSRAANNAPSANAADRRVPFATDADMRSVSNMLLPMENQLMDLNVERVSVPHPHTPHPTPKPSARFHSA